MWGSIHLYGSLWKEGEWTLAEQKTQQGCFLSNNQSACIRWSMSKCIFNLISWCQENCHEVFGAQLRKLRSSIALDLHAWELITLRLVNQCSMETLNNQGLCIVVITSEKTKNKLKQNKTIYSYLCNSFQKINCFSSQHTFRFHLLQRLKAYVRTLVYSICLLNVSLLIWLIKVINTYSIAEDLLFIF